MQKFRQHSILILLIINMAVGLLTFRNYGLSWDEPLFYDYANSLGYAYSPAAWFSGNFNLENAYGASGTDHANRGPAYILIAHPVVSVLESFGMDNASAWHLVNFFTFQIGVYLLYRLSKKWMSKPAALASSALFAWQPLLWGHAFINPKDIPFLVFFLAAICFGFEMADSIAENKKISITKIILAAFFLGIATSIRVLGPLAGVLVSIYALSQFKKDSALIFIKQLTIYIVLTIFVTFIVWPYLWTSPLQKFIEVFGFMSANPTQLKVLFNGNIYLANELPRRYLPVLLGFTLTEPVWLLFFIGLFLGIWKSNNKQRLTLILILLWFSIPAAYVILRKPPMYDGFRHFLFMLPPIFIFAGFAFEKIFDTVKTRWAVISFVLILLLPGIYGALKLHPYEYAYYNSFAGGTSSAFRTYETEYWLTCYREALLDFDQKAPPGSQLFIKREPYIAAYYASPSITIRDYRTELAQIKTGDFVLVNTRTNEDRSTFRDAPVFLSVQRGKAIFCEIKQIP
ncbi:MAG: glycosyltransferase family 39 protein [Chloroflexi bacterium]|nr:glycosyltransferase family 39 protein [Chloroflexota bacterium]